MTTTGTYKELRQNIGDGDLIAVVGSGTPLARLQRTFLRTPYTHTAVALWLDGGLYAYEMHGTSRLVPLSLYRQFDVFDCPVDREELREVALVHSRDPIDYDYWDLVRIGAHETFGWPLPKHDNVKLVCSTLSAHLYLECGWRASLPSMLSPKALTAALGSPKLLIRG